MAPSIAVQYAPGAPRGGVFDGKALRTWRTRVGITQRECAEAWGVSLRRVWGWERGEREVPRWVPLTLPVLARRVQVRENVRRHRARKRQQERTQEQERRRERERRKARLRREGRLDIEAWW